MITIIPYNTQWPSEFIKLGQHLRQHLNHLALRIDHIGSTSVPGLAAKDIIDIQITAQNLTPEVESAINQAGYQRIKRITGDHLPPGRNDNPQEWVKWIFKPLPHQRPVNLHVRLPGRANQRYAILFRDYLRTCPSIAEAYGQVKMVLAQHHPEDDMQVYYAIKDPVCDIIIDGAEIWAASKGWKMGPSDLGKAK